MKILPPNKQSKNIEDLRKEDPLVSIQKAAQNDKGWYNDVLKEPTPIAQQGNNENKKFKPEKNLNIKSRYGGLTPSVKDPSPGFLTHTTVDNLRGFKK